MQQGNREALCEGVGARDCLCKFITSRSAIHFNYLGSGFLTQGRLLFIGEVTTVLIEKK